MAVTFTQAGAPPRSKACDFKLPARLDTPTKLTPAHISNERWPMEPPIDYAIGRSGGITKACQQLGLRLVDVSSGRFATAAPQAERIIPGVGAQQDKQAAVWQWLTKANPLPLQGGVEIPAPDYDRGTETPLTAPSGRLDDVEIPPPDYDCSPDSGLQGAHRDPPPDYKMVRFSDTVATRVMTDESNDESSDAGSARSQSERS